MTERAGYADASDKQQVFTLSGLLIDIFNAFMIPSYMPSFAQTLLDEENSILNGHTTKRSLSDPLAYQNQPFNDPLAGWGNPFVVSGRKCYDHSYQGIDNPTDFVNYLSDQLAENPLIGYYGLTVSSCLSWPNLTNQDVERYGGPFPKQTKNKLLVVGVTNHPFCSFTGAVTTYEFMDPNNAAFLIHDAFGYDSNVQPNNCTTGAMKAYLVNGKLTNQKQLTFKELSQALVPSAALTSSDQITFFYKAPM